MRSYIEHGMQTMPQPVLFYQYGPVFRHEQAAGRPLPPVLSVSTLDVLGSEKSIMGRPSSIKTGMAILEEAGAEGLTIDINSIGDKECRGAYLRELVNYYKKNLKDLPPIDRERLKSNPPAHPRLERGSSAPCAPCGA
ncbi:MAG: hypothetical protein WDN09_02730 [bacterium]